MGCRGAAGRAVTAATSAATAAAAAAGATAADLPIVRGLNFSFGGLSRGRFKWSSEV